MTVIKRLCQAAFALANLLVLAALALTWYGPWTQAASALLGLETYSVAVLSCLGLGVLGSVVLLARALARRAPRTVEVATVDGGTISVTRDAIAAQAAHVVEADGTCAAARVRVDARPRGHVRVRVRVLPHETVDVVAKGAELHEDLLVGLATVCGDTVEDVSLEFVEPEAVGAVPGAGSDEGQGEAPAPGGADSTSEIRLSMGPGPAATQPAAPEAEGRA